MKIWVYDMREPCFLLDTNILSAIIKKPDGAVALKIAQVGPPAVCSSILVACDVIAAGDLTSVIEA